MEDILDVYQRPCDPERPLVCLDETSKQLLAETRGAIVAKPGHPARHDYEYRRNGTANLFMIFAVRPDGAYHQWRKDPSRELSIALVADERFGRVTGWIEAS